MKVTGWLLAAAGIFVILFLFSMVIVKVSWGWIIPDVFAGAVKAGMVVPNLTWYQAAKLAFVLGAIGATFTNRSKD